ncbi:ABC transporter ATP-binding protein [Enterococcus hirae]|nr:ABC transporter ATP-binding protein/permease [Enterococcaceae bacterium]MCI1919441.1 ABC transporter ATP-binding protein/permease [Enterococcaceae bacterium]MDM8213618.1 ABC transporter ATP-binding protein [Enterococcus hirae]
MIRILMKSIREYKKASWLTPAFVTGEVLMDIVMPLLVAALIDQGVSAGDQDKIFYYGMWLTVAAITALILGVLSGRFAAIASTGFAKNLRRDMFVNIQSFSFSNIDRFSPSSLLTRLTTDVTNVQNAYQMIIRLLIRSPLMFVFSIAMAFKVNAELAGTILWVVPGLFVGLFLIIRFAHPLFDKVFKIYDQMNNVVQENLQGIRVVKSYVREDYENKKFQGVSEKIYRNFMKAEKIVALNSPLMQFSNYLSMLLVSWVGAHLIAAQTMTTGELVSMFTYVGQILMSLMMLSNVFVMVLIARTSTERIVAVLQEKSDLTNPAEPLETLANSEVEFDHVSFSYCDDVHKLALKDISFHAKSGEVIGIVGGTGSSKSTLVQLIPRLYDVTSGKLLVGGADVRKYDLSRLRDQVAMVLQNNVLFSGTIAENLRWGNPEATQAELERACQIAQAEEFIATLPEGYETMLSQGGTNLSGGQKQRLTIARALLKQPKILILDDSTSAVDTRTDRLIREGLKKAIPGMTTFIIAQRIASVQDADRTIVLENGQIHGIGTHAELMAHDQIYQEMYNTQQEGFK